MVRVLLLGGTAEARELAGAFAAAGFEAVESVAGRTRQARGGSASRVGGFGGVDGLAQYLRTAGVGAVVDATHPFAARMTGNAAQACALTGVPLLRFARTGWRTHPDASDWVWVGDQSQAAVAAGRAGGRVLLTVGRQPLPAYRELTDVVARVAEWQGDPVPQGWLIVEARGPFTLVGELALLGREQVAVLVSKDSGGAPTAAKLDAARELGVRVIMVHRPPAPDGVPEVGSIADAVAWLAGLG